MFPYHKFCTGVKSAETNAVNLSVDCDMKSLTFCGKK